MERHLKWLLNLLPVNKKREETGKLLLKYCFVLRWHIGKLWCVHILFMLLSSKSLNFVHVIKQTCKDCSISYRFLTEGFWWEILENLGENWWIYHCSKLSVLKSCLTQSLNSVFQLNFDHFFFSLYTHVYNFTPTRNLTSFKDLQRSSNHWDIHQGQLFLLFCALADQPARPNESEKI